MRNGLLLLVIAAAALANGIDTDGLPMWRQLLYAGIAVAAYLHGRRLPTRLHLAVWAVAAAVAAAVAVWDWSEGTAVAGGATLFALLPWLAGRYRHQQARLVEAGRAEIDRLETEQRFIAEQARLRERNRIAADMHDSLGHELALIALRAGALELSPELPPPARTAAAELRAAAVTATDRLRGTIGLLRDGPTPRTPADETVTALVERAAAAGMDVTLRRSDPPGGELTSRAVHRIVQESLTNAARHAPGSRIIVDVTRDADRTEVTVHNTPGDAPATRTSGGTGLAGLTERVHLLGGSLRYGPAPDGFTVAASLPAVTA
ncbi:sensor histidine kinase [Stackebrandtia albiflava]|uniref:sensor histidine kinase n=1 Tax=Stackebrandtia albiflava TaxID=406432 RepID=UPI0011BE433B|nr:histidine kinase [Stackebrandtia albiflava]